MIPKLFKLSEFSVGDTFSIPTANDPTIYTITKINSDSINIVWSRGTMTWCGYKRIQLQGIRIRSMNKVRTCK